MGIYAKIKKEFGFLSKLYGFEIYMKQKHGSYYFVDWTNSNVNIKPLYDLTDDKKPMRILIYDAESLGTVYDVVEYADEFALDYGSPRERIHCAAEWLKSAIEDKIITV